MHMHNPKNCHLRHYNGEWHIFTSCHHNISSIWNCKEYRISFIKGTIASLQFTQFLKISQNDEATYWLDQKGSVAEDCDNDRTHLCWCTRENLSYSGPAIWRNAFVHNDKQRARRCNYTTCNSLIPFISSDMFYILIFLYFSYFQFFFMRQTER